jgi:hypothetical protein
VGSGNIFLVPTVVEQCWPRYTVVLDSPGATPIGIDVSEEGGLVRVVAVSGAAAAAGVPAIVQMFPYPNLSWKFAVGVFASTIGFQNTTLKEWWPRQAR